MKKTSLNIEGIGGEDFMSNYKMFLAKILGLDKLTSYLLVFITEFTAKGGYFYNNNKVREAFLDAMKERGVGYSQTSVQYALKRLVSTGLIVQDGKGIYTVNKGLFKEDAKTVKMSIEFKDQETNTLNIELV